MYGSVGYMSYSLTLYYGTAFHGTAFNFFNESVPMGRISKKKKATTDVNLHNSW